MIIQFLGTGAADWPTKKNASMKEYRRMCSAIIDETLLIDPGPQVIAALEEYNIDKKQIKYVINTHEHGDHFCRQTVKELEKNGAQFIEINAGEKIQLGNYTIYSYFANHATCKNAKHFIIADKKHSVFYGLDGAWLLYDEVQAIKEKRPDLAVLDATIGFVEADYRIFEHNNLNMVFEIKKTLSSYVKRFCISHMAFTLHTDHKTLEKMLKKEEILVAYDGMKIELSE